MVVVVLLKVVAHPHKRGVKSIVRLVQEFCAHKSSIRFVNIGFTCCGVVDPPRNILSRRHDAQGQLILDNGQIDDAVKLVAVAAAVETVKTNTQLATGFREIWGVGDEPYCSADRPCTV